MQNSLKLRLSKSQKRFFLLEFTKGMIRNSGEDIYILDDILKEESKENKKKVLDKKIQINKSVRDQLILQVQRIPLGRPIPEMRPQINPPISPKMSPELKKNLSDLVDKIKVENFKPSLKPIKQIVKPRPVLKTTRLVIPEPQLPTRFQYLKPTRGAREISLGKLDPLLQDPMVRVIECSGPGQDILVIGRMGTKKTGITLSSEEIEEVIDRFSKAAKIPVLEGVFKVVVGRFIFLAVVSEVIGSKFTIRKMIAQIPEQRNQKGQRIPIPQRIPTRRF